MKNLSYIIITIITLTHQDNSLGTYKYNVFEYSEKLELLEKHKFVYSVNSYSTGSQYEIKGYYHFNKDTLILDSYPQKDRLIVVEDSKGKGQNITFEVRDKKFNIIKYNLHLILIDGKEIDIKNQWEKTKLKNIKVKSFYIYNFMGLKSPIYSIIGTHTNYFKLFFEQDRVFEHETWLIEDNKILPRGLDGNFQNYYLQK